MTAATFSVQEIQENFAAAEEAIQGGPVFITKDGQPKAVLIDIAEYRKIFHEPEPTPELAGESLVDLLGVPEEGYFEWEPPRLRGRLTQPLD